MKVIVSESKLGIEYLADVISSCNQNGIECIVDDNAGEILYYLPKESRYGDDKLLQNSDESIFDLVKNREQLIKVLRDAEGDEFKKFAVKWNGLQTKGEDDEVYKTQHCNPIRGNFSEKMIDKSVSESDDSRDWSADEDDVEIEWLIDDRDFSIHKGDTQYVVVDLDLVDSFEELVQQVSDALYKECGEYPMEYDEDWGFVDEDALMKRFGYSVDESGDDPRDWSASEGEIEIEWVTDRYAKKGIESGDTETVLIDYDLVDDNDDLDWEVERMVEKAHPDLDFDTDEYEILNREEFWMQRKGGNPGKQEDDD